MINYHLTDDSVLGFDGIYVLPISSKVGIQNESTELALKRAPSVAAIILEKQTTLDLEVGDIVDLRESNKLPFILLVVRHRPETVDNMHYFVTALTKLYTYTGLNKSESYNVGRFTTQNSYLTPELMRQAINGIFHDHDINFNFFLGTS
jgi:hypothetical protein